MTKILELSKLELPDLEGYTQMLSLPGGNVEEEELGAFFLFAYILHFRRNDLFL